MHNVLQEQSDAQRVRTLLNEILLVCALFIHIPFAHTFFFLYTPHLPCAHTLMYIHPT